VTRNLPVPKGIDEVDHDREIVPEVGDGAGRANFGEDEMLSSFVTSRGLATCSAPLHSG